MNRDYWNAVAADYENEVLSVLDHDTHELVRSRIIEAARAKPDACAADLGCGVGKFTPLLAEYFSCVHACDRSQRGLEKTRLRCAGYPNVHYACFDLAGEPAPFEPVDFVLCVNALLMPGMDERRRAWRAVTNQIAHGGLLVLVVPSAESAQFSYYCAVEEELTTGCSCTEAMDRGLSNEGSVLDLQQGVHSLGGVPTKAYLREELEHMIPAHECDLLNVVKLTYPAITPCTWDWLVTARRRDSA